MDLYLYLLTPRCTILTNEYSYLQQYAKTGFQTVKFLPGILTLTLILSSTSVSSKTTVISN